MKKLSLLLSYPRCGNTLIRYFLEFVTSQATEGYLNSGLDGRSVAATHKYIFLNGKLPKIYKRHVITNDPIDTVDGQIFNQPDNRLILLLRNPLECLIRHAGYARTANHLQETVRCDDREGCPQNYFTNIQVYDNWKGEKQIFYYEDRITAPVKYWTDLNEFVDGDIKQLQEFLNDLQWHLNKARIHYGVSLSQSGGGHVLFHSLTLNAEKKNNLKALIAKKCDELNLKERNFLLKYDLK